MNPTPIQVLITTLDHAIDILADHRTPDYLCVAAFDTLKQARALVVRAFEREIGPRERHPLLYEDEPLPLRRGF
ncbi:MAG TPA: hypothetical protein VHE61_02210 [Opitutaceae bacterium]|nr:hypothetical protein [Opitutaceae bacterium]